jgi:ribosomal protein S3AE
MNADKRARKMMRDVIRKQTGRTTFGQFMRALGSVLVNVGLLAVVIWILTKVFS